MKVLLTFAVLCSMITSLILEGKTLESKSEAQCPVIILLGPPGSGKGTQAVDLSGQLRLPHISTGDLFRYNIKNDTSLGRKAKEYSSKGQLVPDELVLNMVADRVAQEDCKSGYILDGFPRTLPQAEGYEKLLGSRAKLVVVNLEVPDEQIVKRLTGRLMCRSCGQISHKDFSPPKKEGVCDACGGELYQREDDRPEVVENRLEVYHKQTKPLIAFYQHKGALVTVDGNRAKDQVLSTILTDLAHRGVQPEAVR